MTKKVDLKKELAKLMDFWSDYVYLDEEEWSVFKAQVDEITLGKSFNEVKHLLRD